MKKKQDIFELNEVAQKNGMYNDPRWKIVQELRKNGENARANSIVLDIREDFGME